jgi:(p)ppGpp synthase/HD superfamily hydrolase
VKLADRLHNVRRLGACSREKQSRKIEETELYYLPLIPKLCFFNQAAAVRFEKLFDKALKSLKN